MPAQIRPYKKLMKIAYNILKTNDNMQQKNQPILSEERKKEWVADSITAR